MSNPSDKQATGENREEPVIENEAIKNTEDVNQDKKNKEPVSSEDLPGYPHYAPVEDILNPSSDMERVTVDVENITRGGDVAGTDVGIAPSIPPLNDMELPVDDDLDDEDDIGIVPGTDADVTKEDLILLGPKDRDMDMGEDEELQNKGFPLGMTGDDLDLPIDDPDLEEDSLGQGDEENDYYSLGGDNHENLEEDQAGSDPDLNQD